MAGEYRRVKPRLNVVRGFKGNETDAASFSAKPKASEGIKSGMIISLDTNGEWIKGVPATKTPYVAWHDQSDTDVQASGKLLGLSCAGDYEMETGYFDATDTYAIDDALIAGTSALAGSLDKASGMTATADIVGLVTRGGKINNTKTNSEAGTVAGPNYVLSFRTFWSPNRE